MLPSTFLSSTCSKAAEEQLPQQLQFVLCASIMCTAGQHLLTAFQTWTRRAAASCSALHYMTPTPCPLPTCVPLKREHVWLVPCSSPLFALRCSKWLAYSCTLIHAHECKLCGKAVPFCTCCTCPHCPSSCDLSLNHPNPTSLFQTSLPQQHPGWMPTGQPQ
jgi:hypothetical protein